MNFNQVYIKHLHLVIVITFVTSILIISSTTELAFAKNDNKKKDADNKEFKKDVSVSLMDKNKETLNGDLKEIDIQNDNLNARYPDQFFVCGYPQQVITDYNSFIKINCN